MATCSKNAVTYLTCEISSVVSHAWHGFGAARADAQPTDPLPNAPKENTLFGFSKHTVNSTHTVNTQ